MTAVLLVVMAELGDASIAGGERRSAARVSGIGRKIEQREGNGGLLRAL
jgi:hypothetical protein